MVLQLLLVAFLLHIVASGAPGAAGHQHDVTWLPGVNDAALAPGHRSGYLQVARQPGPSLEVFYYYARHADPERPLLVWMSGGPGASSLSGLLVELGPFLVNGRSRPRRVGEPWKLWPNKYGWNTEASVLVWEQPAGVGFSRCAGGARCPVWDDDSSAQANLDFLLAFYAAFPAERTRQLFIFGESYAGIYVPLLANRILGHNGHAPPLQAVPLRGVGVGNGCIGFGRPGACGTDTMGLLLNYFQTSVPGMNHDLLQHAVKVCGDELNRGLDPERMSLTCQAALRQLFEDLGNFNPYLGDGPCGPEEVGNWGEGDVYACGAESATSTYLNSLEAQRALHAVEEGAAQPLSWQQWDGDAGLYNISRSDALPEYQKLLAAGVPVLVWNGLRDTVVPFNGAEKWTRQIGGAVAEPRRLWSVHGQVAGHVVRYSSGLTFATVQGAGHLVPADRPAAALTMIGAFLQDQPLPAYDGGCVKVWLGKSWGRFCGEARPASPNGAPKAASQAGQVGTTLLYM